MGNLNPPQMGETPWLCTRQQTDTVGCPESAFHPVRFPFPGARVCFGSADPNPTFPLARLGPRHVHAAYYSVEIVSMPEKQFNHERKTDMLETHTGETEMLCYEWSGRA